MDLTLITIVVVVVFVILAGYIWFDRVKQKSPSTTTGSATIGGGGGHPNHPVEE